MKAEDLPFADGEFDMTTAIEVLEHVPDAEAHGRRDGSLRTSAGLLVSVPREPLWRVAEHGPRRLLRRTSATPRGT